MNEDKIPMTEEEIRIEDFRENCGYVGGGGNYGDHFAVFIAETQATLNLDDRGLSLILGVLRSEVRAWREGLVPEKYVRRFVGWKIYDAFGEIHPPPPIENTPFPGRVVVSKGPFPIVRRIFEEPWGNPLVSIQPLTLPSGALFNLERDD